MRGTTAGLFVGVFIIGFVISSMTEDRGVHAQQFENFEHASLSDERLATLKGPTVEGQQLIVLIDNQQQTMGSYFVDTKSGQISLRCVRNFRWDLQMSEFNGSEPSPEKIQALLRSR